MPRRCCAAPRQARPDAVSPRGLLAKALFAGLLTTTGTAWADCGESLPAQARQQVVRGGLQLAFAPRPWPLAVGRHFAVDVVACVPAGAGVPDSLRVDADMPAHRHGMNYRASVKPLGQGRFVAEGLMFHMPGRWRFIFDVGSGAQAQRLTQEIEVE
jgi:hypothetical protein